MTLGEVLKVCLPTLLISIVLVVAALTWSSRSARATRISLPASYAVMQSDASFETPIGLGSHSLTQAQTSAEIADRIEKLKSQYDSRQIMDVATFGMSVQGRPIQMVTLARRQDLPCLLVICRQHGDETASTEAALQVMEEFTVGSDPQDLLDSVKLILIPNANPDGTDEYARTGIVNATARPNAAGVNLNRDWLAQSQPETQAIAQQIRMCRPLLIIDEHEDYPEEANKGSYVQAGRGTDPEQIRMTNALESAICRQERKRGVSLRAAGSSNANCSMAHGYWASQGIPSLLIESQQTKAGAGMPRRVGIHRTAILAALTLLAKRQPAYSL